MSGDESKDRTPDSASGAAAPKKVATFLMLTFLLSSVIYYLVTTSFAVDNMQVLIVLLMWCPGVAAIATRLIYQRNLNGFGFS